jgi:GTPase SAR1 family protein
MSLCVKEEDPKRIELTGNSMATYPTFPAPIKRGEEPRCPKCACVANRRACPSCHTALPIEFVDSDSPMIGIVGSKGSGKTVLMTVLVKQLREVVAKQFQASIRLTTDSPDGLAGIEAYRIHREGALYDKGILPAGTGWRTGDSRRVPIVLQWQGVQTGAFGRGKVKTTILSFLDTAGEQLNTLEDTYSLEYLSACDSLIVALDPFALPGARAHLHLPDEAIQTIDGTPLDVIQNITEMLKVELKVKSGKRIGIPIAVVFTKIDAFRHQIDRRSALMDAPARQPWYQELDGQAVHEQMRSLLHDWNASDIDNHMLHNYKNFRFFGVSALGEEPDYTTARASERGVRPLRVEDPLLWLLTQEGAVRSA